MKPSVVRVYVENRGFSAGRGETIKLVTALSQSASNAVIVIVVDPDDPIKVYVVLAVVAFKAVVVREFTRPVLLDDVVKINWA